MELSPHERRILAGIEDQLGRNDPALTEAFASTRLPSLRRWFPLTAVHTALLAAVLVVLILAHPLALAMGTVGIGLLTAALVVPWLVSAASAGTDSPAGSRRRGRRTTVTATGTTDGSTTGPTDRAG